MINRIVLRVYIFDCIFGAFFNAGVRVCDTSNPLSTQGSGPFRPSRPPTAPANSVNDVYVDENRIVYAVDRLKGGLYILELTIRLVQTRSTKSSSHLKFPARRNIKAKNANSTSSFSSQS